MTTFDRKPAAHLNGGRAPMPQRQALVTLTVAGPTFPAVQYRRSQP
jgi:hypothetical protein